MNEFKLNHNCECLHLLETTLRVAAFKNYPNRNSNFYFYDYLFCYFSMGYKYILELNSIESLVKSNKKLTLLSIALLLWLITIIVLFNLISQLHMKTGHSVYLLFFIKNKLLHSSEARSCNIIQKCSRAELNNRKKTYTVYFIQATITNNRILKRPNINNKPLSFSGI